MKFINEQCGRFSFSWDMNADGLVTISDVLKSVDFFFRIPAKFAVEVVAGVTNIARFFEINCLTGEGWGGVIFSAYIWCVIFQEMKKINFFEKLHGLIYFFTNELFSDVPVAWAMLTGPTLNDRKFFYQRIHGLWILFLVSIEAVVSITLILGILGSVSLLIFLLFRN